MQFQVSVGFDRDERRIIQKGAATLRLIEKNLGERFDDMSKSVEMCYCQGGGLSQSRLVTAAQAMRALLAELTRQSRMTVQDWCFEAGHAGVESDTLATIVYNPPELLNQIVDLRKSQMLDVEEAIQVLENGLRKIKALNGIVEVFNAEEVVDE